jgi:hypothetical protein
MILGRPLDARALACQVAVSLPFRIVLAVGILLMHVAMVARVGHTRFDYKFDDSPDHAPLFYDATRDQKPDRWDRLVVARWDSQHYEGIALRGYSTCKTKSELGSGEYPDDDKTCELNFYPTYAWIGAAVAKVTHQPVDLSLFGVSLFASFVFLLLWTSRAMVDRLGVAGVYLSLLLLNVFDTAYSLVLILTEPCLMALSLGAFLCLRERRLWLGALLAGAATGMRVSGVATGLAFCVGVLVMTLRDHPRPRWLWLGRFALMVLSGWGVMALMAFYAHRFGDPLLYAHAHERTFHHQMSLMKVLIPDGRLLIESIWAEPHEGVILCGALLWFALGHRHGLARFPVHEQAAWYALFFFSIAISLPGSVELAYAGNSRYMLTVFPVFFAMAGVLRRRPAALALWVFVSAMHYYNGSICFYVGQNHPERLHRCSFARYFRSEALHDGREQ